MSSAPSSVTVIIETYNLTEGSAESSLLRAAEAAVAQAREVGGDVLVAASGALAPAAEAGLARLGPSVRVLNGPSASYDELKHRAAVAASGTYIAYLDGDCEPAPGWLEAHLDRLRSGAAASAGVTFYRGGWFAKVLTVMDFGFLHDAPPDAVGCYSSNNVAFEREAYLGSPPEGTLRCNCFSHAQDLLRQGTPVHLAPDAVALHDLPPFARERRRRGEDVIEALRDDPERAEVRLLRLGALAAPIFYLSTLMLDWRRLLVGRTRLELGVAGTLAAMLALPALRLLDAVGMIAALRRRRPLDRGRRLRRDQRRASAAVGRATVEPASGGGGGGGWDVEGLVADPLPEGWRRHGRAAHLDLIRRWVGTTSGRWLKTDLQEERTAVRSLLPELDGSWFGVDVAAGVAIEAAARDVCGTAADVRQLPFAHGSFDGVLSTSTLDHFHDVSEIDVSLRELCRVLAPGGRLVLTLDNPENPLIWLRNSLPDRSRRATGLVNFHVGPTLSEAAGRAALERCGFEVLASEHLLHAPHIIGTRSARWGWFERRALPWFDRLSRTRAGRFSGHYVAFLARPRRAS